MGRSMSSSERAAAGEAFAVLGEGGYGGEGCPQITAPKHTVEAVRPVSVRQAERRPAISGADPTVPCQGPACRPAEGIRSLRDPPGLSRLAGEAPEIAPGSPGAPGGRFRVPRATPKADSRFLGALRADSGRSGSEVFAAAAEASAKSSRPAITRRAAGGRSEPSRGLRKSPHNRALCDFARAADDRRTRPG